ncbi:MAG: hypothetical protein JSW16_03110 [Dehalococcoidales bacterium]|nr:MAG: hypothetical protein JSW16_03110 [Dehalococcoidales bacterium]
MIRGGNEGNMDGFHNRVLHIDVTRRSFQEETIHDEVYRELLGGKGLATQLLLSNTKAGVQPFSEDNAIIFATGPATDTRVFGSSRYGVFTKSPLTGIYSESYAGGTVAEPLSRTGYDAVVIKGAFARPVYLEICQGNVRFHDASHLWGMDTYQTEDLVRQEAGSRDAGVVVIGPAGENGVRFAIIENNYWRSAGRTGTGAVLGSKKIKAIAFHGDQPRNIARPDLLNQVWKTVGAQVKKDAGARAYRTLGTPMLVSTTNLAGAFPTRYWSAGTFEKWQNISADALLEQCKVRPRACPRCILA